MDGRKGVAFAGAAPLGLRRSAGACVPRQASAPRRSARLCPRRRAAVCVADAAAEPAGTLAGTLADTQFRERVSGEWFGYEVVFSARDGSAQAIPEHYVPDEFRAWGVEIKGFEVVSSTRVVSGDASPDDDATLELRRTRALPSVGCEADAVATEVKEYALAASTCVGFADGGFSNGPTCMDAEQGQQPVWRFCLAAPDAAQRARLEFSRIDDRCGTVTAVVETWDAEFCGGQVLPGCGGKNESFADGSRLDAARDLAGRWTMQTDTYTPRGHAWAVAATTGEETRSADEAAACCTVAMPRGLSATVTRSASDGVVVSAGWLVDADTRVVATRVYAADGQIERVTNTIERRKHA